jgi:7,8-dihydroneopterin aldolase/epimerase/oxygenase
VNTVSLHGLRIFGHHGVHADERTHGQDFLFDIELEVGDRGSSDRIEDAVDYTAVARTVREVSAAREYQLLEALAGAVADEMQRRFGAGDVAVRVTKPAVKPAGLDGTASVTVSRTARSGRTSRS